MCASTCQYVKWIRAGCETIANNTVLMVQNSVHLVPSTVSGTGTDDKWVVMVRKLSDMLRA